MVKKDTCMRFDICPGDNKIKDKEEKLYSNDDLKEKACGE